MATGLSTEQKQKDNNNNNNNNNSSTSSYILKLRNNILELLQNNPTILTTLNNSKNKIIVRSSNENQIKLKQQFTKNYIKNIMNNNNNNNNDNNKRSIESIEIGNNHSMVDDNANANANDIDNDSGDEAALPQILDNDIIFTLDYPENCMNHLDKIEEFQITEYFQIGKFIQIKLLNFFGPYKFWFKCLNCGGDGGGGGGQDDQDQNTHQKIMHNDDLKDTLNTYYNNEWNIERVSIKCISTLRVGYYCIGKFKNNGVGVIGFNWCRARILEKPKNIDAAACVQNTNDVDHSLITVKCLLIDYGIVCNIPVCDIRYLLKEFSKPSSLAIRGCLDNIRPIGKNFNNAECRRLMRPYINQKLYAQITKINHNDNSIYMELSDMMQMVKNLSNQTRVDINLEIMRTRLGYVFKRKPIEKLHSSENFPTFQDLENGKYFVWQ